jgi:uncharacterized damage-inducible protein DinB
MEAIMSEKNLVQKIVEYHTSTNRRLWEHLREHLQDEQFTTETGFSLGSIRKQVVHLAETDRYWMHDIQVKPVSGLNPEDYPDIDSFIPVFEEIESALLAYTRSLTQEELEAVPDGLLETRQEALVHLVNHGTDHRAQILSMLHSMGAPTFEQDFTSVLRKQRQVRKDDVLALVRFRRRAWEQALDAFPKDRLEVPLVGSWSVKDITAHITWHDREMLSLLQTRRLAGSEWWSLPTQERNRLIYEQHREQPLDEVLRQHSEIHHKLIQEIEKLESEDLNDPDRIDEMIPGFKLWMLLEDNTWVHYFIHTEDLWELSKEV